MRNPQNPAQKISDIPPSPWPTREQQRREARRERRRKCRQKTIPVEVNVKALKDLQHVTLQLNPESTIDDSEIVSDALRAHAAELRAKRRLIEHLESDLAP